VTALVLLAAGASVPPATAAQTATPAQAAPAGAPALAAAVRTSAISGGASDRVLRKGETFWFTGRLTIGGSRAADRTVVLQQRVPGSSGWRTIRSTRTNRDGWFGFTLRPDAVRDYRARFAGTSTARSDQTGAHRVSFTATSRSLASRADQIGGRLGRATSGVRKVSANVSFRSYANGRLVSVAGRATRTWWVRGDILDTYLAQGGVGGRLGLPTQDARCGLAWGGCVQRFTKGVVYENSRGHTGVSRVGGLQGEVIAAARSQVGYSVRYSGGPNRSRFNTWMGNSNPWCSFLISWAFAGSGNRSLAPQSGRFGDFARAVRTTMPTGSKPRVGAIAVLSYLDSGAPSHAQYVVDWSSSSRIKVIHGNTGGFGTFPSGVRGVAEQWVGTGRVLYYGYPRY